LLNLERLEERRMLSNLQLTAPNGTAYTLTDPASGGWLEMQVGGLNAVNQVIDTNVAKFAIDGSGAAVALEDTGNLVLFAANSASSELMLKSVQNFVVDGALCP